MPEGSTAISHPTRGSSASAHRGHPRRSMPSQSAMVACTAERASASNCAAGGAHGARPANLPGVRRRRRKAVAQLTQGVAQGRPRAQDLRGRGEIARPRRAASRHRDVCRVAVRMVLRQRPQLEAERFREGSPRLLPLGLGAAQPLRRRRGLRTCRSVLRQHRVAGCHCRRVAEHSRARRAALRALSRSPPAAPRNILRHRHPALSWRRRAPTHRRLPMRREGPRQGSCGLERHARRGLGEPCGAILRDRCLHSPRLRWGWEPMPEVLGQRVQKRRRGRHPVRRRGQRVVRGRPQGCTAE